LKISFTEHPASVKETYLQHMASAWSFSGTLCVSSIAAFVHGLFPFLFVTTASQMVTRLYDRMVANRRRQ
jgi:Family of unknown function (DUF6356)